MFYIFSWVWITLDATEVRIKNLGLNIMSRKSTFSVCRSVLTPLEWCCYDWMWLHTLWWPKWWLAGPILFHSSSSPPLWKFFVPSFQLACPTFKEDFRILTSQQINASYYNNIHSGTSPCWLQILQSSVKLFQISTITKVPRWRQKKVQGVPLRFCMTGNTLRGSARSFLAVVALRSQYSHEDKICNLLILLYWLLKK